MVPCVFNWEDMHDAPASLLFTEHKRLRSCQRRSCVNRTPPPHCKPLFTSLSVTGTQTVWEAEFIMQWELENTTTTHCWSQTLECTGFFLLAADFELFVSHFWSIFFLASHAHYAQISYGVESESGTWSELCAEQINLALRILGLVMMRNGLGNMSTIQTIDVSTARVWVSWHPMFFSFERA